MLLTEKQFDALMELISAKVALGKSADDHIVDREAAALSQARELLTEYRCDECGAGYQDEHHDECPNYGDGPFSPRQTAKF